MGSTLPQETKHFYYNGCCFGPSKSQLLPCNAPTLKGRRKQSCSVEGPFPPAVLCVLCCVSWGSAQVWQWELLQGRERTQCRHWSRVPRTGTEATAPTIAARSLCCQEPVLAASLQRHRKKQAAPLRLSCSWETSTCQGHRHSNWGEDVPMPGAGTDHAPLQCSLSPPERESEAPDERKGTPSLLSAWPPSLRPLCAQPAEGRANRRHRRFRPQKSMATLPPRPRSRSPSPRPG